jgi:hypothetical protein
MSETTLLGLVIQADAVVTHAKPEEAKIEETKEQA